MEPSGKTLYVREKILDRGLTSLKGIGPERMETIIQLANEYDLRPRNSKPLLTIELQDESSVPDVFYKGEEVKDKTHVNFIWDTKDDVRTGGLTYAIEHYEKGNERLTLDRIERMIGDHAY